MSRSRPFAPTLAHGAEPENWTWGLVLLLALGQFLAFVDRGLPAVVAPLLKTDLNLSDAQIGALHGPAFVVLYVVGLLAAGQWIWRYDARRVAGACVLAWTAGGMLFVFAGDYRTLIIARIILGAGQAAFAPAALMLIGGLPDAGRRARALSMFTTGSATGRSGALLLGGAALAALAGGTLLGLQPWRAACLLLVAPNIVLGAVLLARRGPGSGAHRASIGDLGRAWRYAARRSPAFASVTLAGAGSVLVVQTVGAWCPSILHRVCGLSPGQSALAYGIIVLTGAPLGHLGAGWALGSRKGQARPGLILATAAGTTGLGAALLSLTATPSLVLAGMSALTITGGFAAAATLITLQAITPGEIRASMGALFLAVTTMIGVGAGPWLAGIVSDILGDGARSLSMALALIATPTACVVLSIALASGDRWRARPTCVGSRSRRITAIR